MKKTTTLILILMTNFFVACGGSLDPDDPERGYTCPAVYGPNLFVTVQDEDGHLIVDAEVSIPRGGGFHTRLTNEASSCLEEDSYGGGCDLYMVGNICYYYIATDESCQDDPTSEDCLKTDVIGDCHIYSNDLTPGDYTVVVTKEGFLTSSQEITMIGENVCSANNQFLTVTLEAE